MSDAVLACEEELRQAQLSGGVRLQRDHELAGVARDVDLAAHGPQPALDLRAPLGAGMDDVLSVARLIPSCDSSP